MSLIPAAEVKKRGVSAFEDVLAGSGEAIITVRGRARYVVMSIEQYDAFREAELSRAVREARADYEAGRVSDRSVADHLRRLDDEV